MKGKPTYKDLENRVKELMAEQSRLAKVEAELKKSLRFTESLLSALPTPIFFKDTKGRYQGCNLSFSEIMGLSANELRGKTVEELWPSEYAKVYHEKDLELMQQPKRQVYEFEIKDKNGNHRPVIFYKNVIKDEKGYVVGLVGGFIDITEQKRAKDILKKNEMKYRKLFEGSTDAIFIVDKSSGRYLDANAAAEELTGMPVSTLRSLTTHDLTPNGANQRLKTLEIENRPEFKEVVYHRNDGSTRIARLSVVPLDDETVYGIAHDITERKRAKRALQKSEKKFKSLANNLNVGIYRIAAGAKGKFVEANPALIKMFGYENKEEFLRNSVSAAYRNPSDRKTYLENLIKKGASKNVELKLQKQDGTPIIGSASAVVVKDENGEIEYYDGIIEDITERKVAEEILRQSEENYRAVLEANPDPVVVYDIEGKVKYFNPAFTRVFGWSLKDRVGKKMDLFVPEKAWRETKMMIDKVLAGEWFSGIETIRYDKNGKTIPVSVSGTIYKDQNGDPIGSIINLRDISNQKEMEGQLKQAQKMESIGTLAGGIAHDFNNILTSILGYSELALDDLPPGSSLKNIIEAIYSSGKRARDLVTQILAFSRKDEHARSPVQMEQIIKDALKLLRPAIPTTIDIQTHLNSECCIIGDPSRIHQIIMNLCTNAYQAMLETGGKLNISLSQADMKGELSMRTQLPAGTYGQLIISDTGVGIPCEIINRIFEPYFTTKEKGKGTGLGLAAVHGIVKNHGGAILVNSQPGMGTHFEVYLPLAIEQAEIEEKADCLIICGQERILLVDDTPEVLEIEEKMLQRLGYTVTAKKDVKDALELFSRNPEKFDLVITDMTMPIMTGEKFAVKLKEISPDIPVILCTGYSELITKEKADNLGIKGFLMKPVTTRDFSNAITTLFGKKRAAA